MNAASTPFAISLIRLLSFSFCAKMLRPAVLPEHFRLRGVSEVEFNKPLQQFGSICTHSPSLFCHQHRRTSLTLHC